VNTAGGAVLKVDEAAQPIAVMDDEFPHHKHGVFQQRLAAIPEKDVVVLPAALGVAHEHHGGGFGALVLDYADIFSREIVLHLKQQWKVLSKNMHMSIGIRQTLSQEHDPSVFLAHARPPLFT